MAVVVKQFICKLITIAVLNMVQMLLFQLVLLEIDTNGFHRTLCDTTSLCELSDADIYAVEVEERHRRQSTCDTVTAILLNRDCRTGLW